MSVYDHDSIQHYLKSLVCICHMCLLMNERDREVRIYEGIKHSYASPSTMQDGISPLYAASKEGHAEVVDTLLKSGADPNLVTMVWILVCLHLCTVAM